VKQSDRIKGFEDAIKDEPDMEILTTEACNSDMLTGTQKAQDMLKAYPEMTAIFGSEGTGAVAAGASGTILIRPFMLIFFFISTPPYLITGHLCKYLHFQPSQK